MKKYEITFIVRPDLGDEEINKTAEELKKLLKKEKATLISEKAEGQKELAYEIKKYTTGYYFFYEVEASNEAIFEFDRVAKINENLLRHLIIKVDE